MVVARVRVSLWMNVKIKVGDEKELTVSLALSLA